MTIYGTHKELFTGRGVRWIVLCTVVLGMLLGAQLRALATVPAGHLVDHENVKISIVCDERADLRESQKDCHKQQKACLQSNCLVLFLRLAELPVAAENRSHRVYFPARDDQMASVTPTPLFKPPRSAFSG